MDEKGEIALDRFTQAFTLDLHQVMNFYRQHWTDPITAIGLSGDSLVAEARAIIAATEPVPVISFADVVGGTIPDAWIIALGSGLRGASPKKKDHEITFLGEGARKLFEDSRMLNFLSFWRVAIPVVLGILFGVFVLADIFLRTTESSAALYSTSVVSARTDTEKEMTDLVAQATNFNNSVNMIASVQKSLLPRYAIINAISGAAATNNVVITRITLQSDGSMLVAGQAQSEDAILAFKSAIEKMPGFSSVNLPLAGIQGGGSSYSFSMTFSVK
jgi:hypothetical protein